MSQRNQKQNAIHLSVDCWIQANASDKIAASSGQRLVSNTISGHESNSHESSCTCKLAARSKYLKSHETSCVFQLTACAKCLRSQASCIAFRTLACPPVASTNIIKADFDVSNLLFQIFTNIEADLNFIQYSSSDLWQMNKMCGASRMEANEHKFIIRASSSAAQHPLFTKPNKYFRLVVKFIISNSEGERFVLKSTFGLIVKSILIQNDLINKIFDVAAVVQAFIYNTPGTSAFKSRIRYSKISLVFDIDCRIFCEGLKGNAVVEQKLENTKANCSILPFPLISNTVAMAKPNVQAQVNAAPLKMTATENMCTSAIKCSSGLVGHIDCISLDGLKLYDLVGCTGLIGQIKIIGLIGHTSLIGLNEFVEHILVNQNDLMDCNDLVDQNSLVSCNNIANYIGLFGHIGLVGRIGHNGLVGFMGLGLVGLIGLSRVSLIGQISRIDSLALLNHWPIGLIGIIGFGLIALSASVASLAYWPCNFAAATHQVDTVSCTSPNSYNGVSGLIGGISLVGQISLVSLSALSGISGLSSHNVLINFINHNGLVGFLDIVNLAGLISNISLAKLIGDISFIGGFVGYISLGLICLVSLCGFSGINNYILVKLIGHISLVGLICFSGWLTRAWKKMWWWIASFGNSNHNDMFPYRLAAAILAGAAKNTQSCHQADKRYQNYQCSNLV